MSLGSKRDNPFGCGIESALSAEKMYISQQKVVDMKTGPLVDAVLRQAGKQPLI